MRSHPYGVLLRFAPFGLILVVVSACHIKLVSDYDDNFVQAATSTQKEIVTLLQTLKNPPPGTDITYKGNISAYNKIDVGMNNLAVLASAHQNNDPTIVQVDRVNGMVRDLENLHSKANTLSPAFLAKEQQDINTGFAIIIRTENDKKAGLNVRAQPSTGRLAMANFDIGSVATSVLNAARGAAGSTWDQIQHDFARDLQGVLQSAAQIAEQLATRQISEPEAEVLVRNESAILFLLEQEVELDTKIVVQNAVNAGIDTLLAAVKTAAGLA